MPKTNFSRLKEFVQILEFMSRFKLMHHFNQTFSLHPGKGPNWVNILMSGTSHFCGDNL
jgi:hypothetical protein